METIENQNEIRVNVFSIIIAMNNRGKNKHFQKRDWKKWFCFFGCWFNWLRVDGEGSYGDEMENVVWERVKGRLIEREKKKFKSG